MEELRALTLGGVSGAGPGGVTPSRALPTILSN